jgi:hypothetical protein
MMRKVFFLAFFIFSLFHLVTAQSIANQLPLINLGPDTSVCRYSKNLSFNIKDKIILPYHTYASPCDTVKQACGTFAGPALIANNSPSIMAGIDKGKTNPFQLNVKGAKVQYLIKKGQFSNLANITAKTIKFSKLTFFVKDRNGIPNGLSYTVNIRISCVPDTTIPVDLFIVNPNLKPVFTGGFNTSSLPASGSAGTVTFTFNRGSYVWDKESNLLVEMCWQANGSTSNITLNPTVEGVNSISFAGNNMFYDTIPNQPLPQNLCTRDSANSFSIQTTQPKMDFGYCDNARSLNDFQIYWSSVPNGILTGNPLLTNLLNNSTIPVTATPPTPIPWKIKVVLKEASVFTPNLNPTLDADSFLIDIRFAPTFTRSYPDNTICSNEIKFQMDTFYKPASPMGPAFDRVYPLSSGLTGYTAVPDPITGIPKHFFDPSQAVFFFPIPSKFIYEIKDGPCFFRDTSTLFIKRFDDATINKEPVFCTYTSPRALSPINPISGAIFSGSGITSPLTGMFDPQVAGVGSHLITYVTPGVCGDTGTEYIIVADQPKFLIGPTQIDGCTPFSLTLNTNGPSLLKKYNWSFPSIQNGAVTSTEATPTRTFTKLGLNKVELIAEDTNGCADTTERYVNVFPIPDAKFTPSKREITNVFGEVIFTNNTTSAEKFNWKIEEFASVTKYNTSDYMYDFKDKAGTFVVQLIATNVENCSDTASDTIVVVSDYKFYIPDAFNVKSPAPNNVFKYILKDANTSEDFSFIVFDKWGGVIFESKKNGEFWNGRKFNTGQKCDAGLYVWQISFRDFAKKKQRRSGNILLIE